MFGPLIRTVLTAALMLAAPVSAQAGAFLSGSFAITAFTKTTSDLATTSVFLLNPHSYILSNGSGDFNGMMGAVSTSGSLNLANATTFDFTDPKIGSFVADPGSVLVLPSSPGAKSLFVSGHFTVGSGFTNAGATFTANETFNFTQMAGAGNAIAISGTFQSPIAQIGTQGHQVTVPEPAGAGLIAMGLMGVAAWTSRRAQRFSRV